MKAKCIAIALAMAAAGASAEEPTVYRATMINVFDAATIVVRYSRPGEMGQDGVAKITMLSEGTPSKPGCDPEVNTKDSTIQALRASLKASSFVLDHIERNDKGLPIKAVVRLKDGASMLDILTSKGLYCLPKP